jgi:RND family efflux transporter MFP subunit
MRWIFKLIPLLVVLLVAGTWFTRQLRPEVLVAPVTRGTAVDAVTATAKVLAQLDVTLKSERMGRVRALPAELGKPVDKGVLLVQLDETRQQLDLAQLEIRLAALEERRALGSPLDTDIANRRAAVEALEAQVRLNSAAPARLEAERRELQRAELQLRREAIDAEEQRALLRTQIEALNWEIGLMQTLAPFECEVVEIMVGPGAFVHAGNNLARVVSRKRSVELTLSEEDFGGVRPGLRVVLRLAGYPGREFGGTVSSLSATANADNKTRTLLVELDDAQTALVPGLSGEAYLVKEERAGALIVPRRALIGNTVFVVADGRVAVRAVQPGFVSLNKAEIVGGLQEGDLVILENQATLRAGDRVIARHSLTGIQP